MATRATAPRPTALPKTFAALDRLREAIERLDRPAVAMIATIAIDRLDQIDGDPEREPDGDEQDGTRAEDEPYDGHAYGPGCPISDGGEDNGDAADTADAEDECLTARALYYGSTGAGCVLCDDDHGGDGS